MKWMPVFCSYKLKSDGRSIYMWALKNGFNVNVSKCNTLRRTQEPFTGRIVCPNLGTVPELDIYIAVSGVEGLQYRESVY
jgi:hypothetical protein